jgi:hypothetical protein
MMAIGLGKQAGAAVYHQAMLSYGYPKVILSVARRVMHNTSLLFGLGAVENGYGQTARIGLPLVTAEPESPRIKRIVVCDLTDGSEGNAVGVGIADIITQRLLDKIDMDALNINTITGVCPEMGKIPLTLKNDKEAIEIAIKCVGLIPRKKLKIMRIKNTSALREVELSEAYEKALSSRRDLEVVKTKRAMEFDAAGNLEPF